MRGAAVLLGRRSCAASKPFLLTAFRCEEGFCRLCPSRRWVLKWADWTRAKPCPLGASGGLHWGEVWAGRTWTNAAKPELLFAVLLGKARKEVCNNDKWIRLDVPLPTA